MSSTSACKVFFFSQTGAGKFPALPYLHSTVHKDVQWRRCILGSWAWIEEGKIWWVTYSNVLLRFSPLSCWSPNPMVRLDNQHHVVLQRCLNPAVIMREIHPTRSNLQVFVHLFIHLFIHSLNHFVQELQLVLRDMSHPSDADSRRHLAQQNTGKLN